MGKTLQLEINGVIKDLPEIIVNADGKSIDITQNPTITEIQNSIANLQKNPDTEAEEPVTSYVLPESSTSTLGGIKIDGSTLIKNNDGTYSAVTKSTTTTVDEKQLATAISSYISSNPLSSAYPILSTEGNTVVNTGYPYGDVRRYGAKGNGSTDDTTAIKNAIASGNNDIYFPTGTYLITSTLTAPTGMRFKGDGYEKTMLKITTSAILFDVQGKNTFEDLYFNSTYGTVSVYGLLNFNNKGSNTFVRGCRFTSTSGNGLKVIGETGKVQNVIIERCNFTTLGRMGIEFQNHAKTNILYDGYSNITVRDCMFYKTGLKEYGMGISFSGWGMGCTIDNNSFEEMAECAIEFVGCCSSTVCNNTFNYSSNKYILFEFTNARAMHDNVIINNHATGLSGITRSFIRSNTRLTFANNTVGQLEIRDVTFSNFTGNTIISNGNYGIFIEGTSICNRFTDTYIDATSFTSSFYSDIRLAAANVKRNTFQNIMMVDKKTGSYTDANGGASLSDNTFSNIQTVNGTTIYQ